MGKRHCKYKKDCEDFDWDNPKCFGDFHSCPVYTHKRLQHLRGLKE